MGGSASSSKRELEEPREKSATPLGHCICGSASVDYSSMIKCHACCNHFHSNCIGISKQKASLLKHFYCPSCMDKNPQLVTEVERKAEEEEEEEEEEAEQKAETCERKVEINRVKCIPQPGARKRKILRTRKSNRA